MNTGEERAKRRKQLIMTANYYIYLGYKIVPLVMLNKTPLTLPGICEHGVNSAISDQGLLPDAFVTGMENIGISCEGLVVIDVDPKNGGEVPSWLQNDDFVKQRTPSGGMHFFFYKEEGMVVKNQSHALGVGIDVKTDGGYIVVAPSVLKKGEDLVEYRFETELRPRFMLPKLPDEACSLLKKGGEAGGTVRGEGSGAFGYKLKIIASKLKELRSHVRIDGHRIYANCPCHYDTIDSLRIAVTDDGHVLVKCFAGCRFEDIVKKLGLERSFWTPVREKDGI